MKQKIIFILILLSWIPCSTYAVTDITKKKYPYTILTNDYGILNERDLYDGLKSEPFSLESPPKDAYAHIYWQCLSREDVSTTLEDIGYSSYPSDDNDGMLIITAYVKPGISHKYATRRNWPIMGVEERFNRWLKLMKGEKYVCLAGRFGFREEKVTLGKKQQVYVWVFERMKTKKGCDSYFIGDCKGLKKADS